MHESLFFQYTSQITANNMYLYEILISSDLKNAYAPYVFYLNTDRAYTPQELLRYALECVDRQRKSECVEMK